MLPTPYSSKRKGEVGMGLESDEHSEQGDTDTEFGWHLPAKKRRPPINRSIQQVNGNLMNYEAKYEREISARTSHPIVIRFWLPDGRRFTHEFQTNSSVQEAVGHLVSVEPTLRDSLWGFLLRLTNENRIISSRSFQSFADFGINTNSALLVIPMEQ